MLWVAWRQHRAQAVGAAAVAAVIAAYAVAVGFVVRDAAVDSGLAGCPPGDLAMPDFGAAGGCALLVQDLLRRFDRSVGVLGFVLFLPLLVGAFVGAPLVARELERGTHLLAWAQGVTRGRWLLTRVAVAAAGVVVSMAVLTPAIGWLHAQYYGITDGPSGAGGIQFDLHDLAPATLALAVLGIGVAAGALIRRSLPAMAVTLALGFGLVQLVAWLRVRLIEPIRIVAPYGEAVARPSDLVVSEGIIDGSGNVIGFEEVDRRCANLLHAPSDVADPIGQLERYEACLHDAGIRSFALVHPDERYWILQGLNAAMLVAAALLALALAYWATVRRTR